jgi:hypothetical protein
MASSHHLVRPPSDGPARISGDKSALVPSDPLGNPAQAKPAAGKVHFFGKLLKHDCRMGFSRNLALYGISMVAFISLSLLFVGEIRALATSPLIDAPAQGKVSGTFVDLVTYHFKGRVPYVPNQDIPFTLPFDWIAIQVFVALLVGYYPVRDFRGYASQVLIRTKNKWQWWLSKSLWVMLTVICFYLLAFLIALTVSLASGWGIPVESAAIGGFAAGVSLAGLPPEQVVLLFLVPVLLSIALSLVQMVLSFAIGPLWAFMGLMAYNGVSAYADTNLLIGDLSMVLRNPLVGGSGLSSELSLVLSAGVSVAAIVFGAVLFKYQDVSIRKQE